MTLMSVVLGLEKISPWWRTWLYFIKEGSGITAVCPCNGVWILLLQGGEWRCLCQVFSLCFSWALVRGFENKECPVFLRESKKLSGLFHFLPVQVASTHAISEKWKSTKKEKNDLKSYYPELTLIFWYCMPCWVVFFFFLLCIFLKQNTKCLKQNIVHASL